MNSPRRPLGTGPTAPEDSAGGTGDRLLPAERAEPGSLLADQEHDDQKHGQHGRRTLGTGQNDAAS